MTKLTGDGAVNELGVEGRARGVVEAELFQLARYTALSFLLPWQ